MIVTTFGSIAPPYCRGGVAGPAGNGWARGRSARLASVVGAVPSRRPQFCRRVGGFPTSGAPLQLGLAIGGQR